MSTTSIRQAILKAADHIERNPRAFDYQESELPSCGTPSCAIGWIAFFRGIEGPFEATKKSDAVRAIGIPWAFDSGPTFCERMDATPYKNGWRFHSNECARALRLYADKFHAAKPVVIPDWQAIASERTVPDDVQVSAHQVVLT